MQGAAGTESHLLAWLGTQRILPPPNAPHQLPNEGTVPCSFKALKARPLLLPNLCVTERWEVGQHPEMIYRSGGHRLEV